MKYHYARAAAAAAVLSFLFVIPAGDASAQSAKSLVGTYEGVAFRGVDASGKTFDIFGSNPRALMVLTPDGRYSIIVMRASLPKFAANSRIKGSAEENQSVVTGSLAHFGKYSIDAKDKTITFHVESATYPNWDGVPQKRPFTYKGGELSYKVAVVSGGVGAGDVVWKRIK